MVLFFHGSGILGTDTRPWGGLDILSHLNGGAPYPSYTLTAEVP